MNYATSLTMSLEIQLADSVLRSYVGDYEFAPDAVLSVTLVDGQLYAQMNERPRAQIFAESPIQFFCPAANVRILFARDRSRLVTGLILQPKHGRASLAYKRF